MRKIFIFAVALLASISLWADDATFVLTSIFDGTNFTVEVTDPANATISTNAGKNSKDGKLGSDGNYFQIVLNDATFNAASMNGYINTTSTSKNWAFQFSTDGGETWSEEVTQANDGDKSEHEIAVTVTIPNGANGFRVIRRAGTSTIVSSITLSLGTVTPSTDPVTEVTISGPTAGWVGETVDLEAKFDATPDTIFWTIDGVLQESFTKKMSFELVAERTYRVICAARNQYNDEDNWAIGEINVVSSVKGDPVACAELYPATTGDTPAEGAKVALKENSYGGKIIFAGAKNNDFAASFQYNDYGLQMCKGSADFVRVELGFNLKNESIIKMVVRQDNLSGDKTRGFKLNSPDNKSTLLTAAWQQADETDLEKVFEYTVKTGDKLIGQNMFCIARSESAILNALIVYDCGEALPEDTDPVTAATVAGAATALVGQTVKLTCTADKADTYQWYLNETAIEGATAAVYNFAPEAAGEYSFYCTASNEYTTTPVVSNTLVISVSDPLPQVDVTAATIWDWTKAASTSEIKPTKNARVLLANVAGMNNNADFNSQALLFEGEYAIRDSKYCQGQLLQFHTTVPGYTFLCSNFVPNCNQSVNSLELTTVLSKKAILQRQAPWIWIFFRNTGIPIFRNSAEYAQKEDCIEQRTV